VYYNVRYIFSVRLKLQHNNNYLLKNDLILSMNDDYYIIRFSFNFCTNIRRKNDGDDLIKMCSRCFKTISLN